MELETERLKRLKAERAALDARIQQEERKLTEAERKKETQRLIIEGRAMRQWAKRSNENAEIYRRELEAFCTRNIDRALFGFPLLQEEPKRTTRRAAAQQAKNEERPSVH